MALSEIELARVKRTVGDFCTRRNRPEMRDELLEGERPQDILS